MSDTRQKNVNWTTSNGGATSFEAAQLAVMMDIRDELQTLNGVFRCHNFLAIPNLLRDIARNTTKRRRKAKR